MHVWFDTAGLHETFEDIDLSEYFDDDPDYIDRTFTYGKWKLRRI